MMMMMIGRVDIYIYALFDDKHSLGERSKNFELMQTTLS